MDRLRRKIQKELKKRRPGFDEWYENNREKLGCFKEPSAEVANGNTLAKARNICLPDVVAVLFIAFCMAVILPFMFNKSDEKTFLKHNIFSTRRLCTYDTTVDTALIIFAQQICTSITYIHKKENESAKIYVLFRFCINTFLF